MNFTQGIHNKKATHS